RGGRTGSSGARCVATLDITERCRTMIMKPNIPIPVISALTGFRKEQRNAIHHSFVWTGSTLGDVPVIRRRQTCRFLWTFRVHSQCGTTHSAPDGSRSDGARLDRRHHAAARMEDEMGRRSFADLHRGHTALS